MTEVTNGILKGMDMTSHITKLRGPGKIDCDRKKPRTLMRTLSTEHDARQFSQKHSGKYVI